MVIVCVSPSSTHTSVFIDTFAERFLGTYIKARTHSHTNTPHQDGLKMLIIPILLRVVILSLGSNPFVK
jgi:hypothetical protein